MKNKLLIRATGVSSDTPTRILSGMCKGRGALVRSGEPRTVCEENVVPLTHYPTDGNGPEILIAMRNNVVGRIDEDGFRVFVL